MADITWRQVAYWRATRHYLVERAERRQMQDVIRQICGVHAQLMSAAELAVCARVKSVVPQDVQQALWTERALVKTWAMRGTLHLLTADDLPLYVAAMRPTRTAYLRASWQKGHGITRADIDAIMAGVPQALDGRSLTREELADELARQAGSPRLKDLLLSGWGALLKPSAFSGDLCFGPNRGRSVTFARPDQWLGKWRDVDSEEALPGVLRRFLAAYGPASRADFNRWWGVEPGKLRALFQNMESELVEVNVEGYPAWALAADVDSLKAAPGPLSVRLLPHFDPVVVADHNLSRRLLPPGVKERVFRPQGWISPVVLVNGQIEGVWGYEQKRAQLKVTVEWFALAAPQVKQQVEAEAERLGELLEARASVVYGSV